LTFVFGTTSDLKGYGKVNAYYDHYRTGGKGFGVTKIDTRPCSNADFLFPDQKNDVRLLQTEEAL
jgi:hypothetical protein